MIHTQRKTRCAKLTLGRIFQVLVIAVIAFIATAGAFANDSTARFDAGGIELMKTDHIRMISEVLEISPKRVTVAYRFMNESAKDINTTVAFPFPGYNHPLDLLYVPGIEGCKTLAATFRVVADGRTVAPNRVRKAVVGNQDVTEELRKSGLSEAEIFYEVSPDNLLALAEGLEKYQARFGKWWKVQETAYWEQLFPAGKEVVIQHSYSPATGYGYASVSSDKSSADFKRDMSTLWTSFTGKHGRENEDCLDENVKRIIIDKVRKAASKLFNGVPVSYVCVEYILGTGGNWKGPIGDFTLRLEKAKPEQVVSVCFPGKPRKIGSTVYEFHQKDFVPPDKLVVYFYTVGPEVTDTNNP